MTSGKFRFYRVRQVRHRQLSTFCIAGRMAMGMLSLTTAELIEAIRKCDADNKGESSSDMLRFLSDARDLREELSELIQAAELRHAVAMANVCAEDGSVRAAKPA